MTPVTTVAVTPFTRQYPHVSEVADPPTQQTTRLLWDRIHDLEGRLQAAEATLTKLVASSNTNETAAAAAAKDAKVALALTQQPGAPAGSTTTGGGVALPGGGDGGAGGVGCSAAGPTGHDTGGLLNAIRAGQIVCGTGNEFSALKNATTTQAARDANQTELLRRMIWHLQLAGFTSGRQRNPSGVISGDKLCVIVDSVLRVYDVFPGVDFTVPLTTQMNETAPANLVDDAGIPD